MMSRPVGDRPAACRVITSVAPIRICDNGGWTDTWFARRGKVFNIAVRPRVEVQIEVREEGQREGRLIINAANYGDRYERTPGAPYDRHPLLEAAIDRLGAPTDVALELTLHSEVAGGAATGTSASVVVALLAALDRLNGGQLMPYALARAAHEVETMMLGRQSGVQDQMAAAHGGISLIDITEYPEAVVTRVELPAATRAELERRLALVFLGPHSSSALHEKVIRELEGGGPASAHLETLRHTAERSCDALRGGRFEELGRVMVENTEAQARLHPDLVGRDARRAIAIARAHGAVGWKVNGAGGEGGSLTLLAGPSSEAKRTMLREIGEENRNARAIPIALDDAGVTVWEWPPR
jgi:D-glycero-alpha-D-manno-heptose-7-phosphate kinase